MIYEHYVDGGWIGLENRFCGRLNKKIPVLLIGTPTNNDKIKTVGVFLVKKNTEILSDLHEAIGRYLEQQARQRASNEQIRP